MSARPRRGDGSATTNRLRAALRAGQIENQRRAPRLAPAEGEGPPQPPTREEVRAQIANKIWDDKELEVQEAWKDWMEWVDAHDQATNDWKAMTTRLGQLLPAEVDGVQDLIYLDGYERIRMDFYVLLTEGFGRHEHAEFVRKYNQLLELNTSLPTALPTDRRFALMGNWTNYYLTTLAAVQELMAAFREAGILHSAIITILNKELRERSGDWRRTRRLLDKNTLPDPAPPRKASRRAQATENLPTYQERVQEREDFREEEGYSRLTRDIEEEQRRGRATPPRPDGNWWESPARVAAMVASIAALDVEVRAFQF